MRRRLLFSTLAVAVTAVLLFGVPLAFVMIRLQVSAAHDQVQRDATTLARELQNRLRSGQPVDLSDVADAAKSLPDRYVSIRQAGRSPETFGDPLPRGDGITASAVTSDFRVTVAADTSMESAGVTKAVVLTGGLALAALAVAVVLAMIQGRRLMRPLHDLAGAADRIGSTDGGPLGRRYGIPELDRVAEGLDASARRISELLAAEREFAADASHQLRTPLTALSMRLEEMLAAADRPDVVREEGAAALLQTERLASVVSQLLGRARTPARRAPEPVAVDDVVAQQVVEWEPAFRHRHRKLEVTGEKGLFGYGTPGTLAQVIATLLDNALVHGGGTVTVRTSRTQNSVKIEVSDEGEGVPPELAGRIFERNVSSRPGGTGLGLALARSIAAAEGGQVVLVQSRPAVFAVFLPASPLAEQAAPVVSGPA
jgi:signal transduction histidine kinase